MVYQQVSRVFDTTNFYIATYDDKAEEWTLKFQMERGERQPPSTHKLEHGAPATSSHREPLLLRNRQEPRRFWSVKRSR